MISAPPSARPRIGVIGVAGGWSSELLADRIAERTGMRLLVDMDRVCLDLGHRRVVFDDCDLNDLDAIVVKKLGRVYRPELLDRLEILRVVEESGVPIFSSPASIARLIDRLSCTVSLGLAGIPMPPTVVTEDIGAAAEAVQAFERAILKPLFTSKARGMELLESGNGVRERLRAFRESGNPVFYIQKMVKIPGADLGVAFLGGEYLGTYARVAPPTSWNTSTQNGAKYRPYETSAEIVELAHRAQALFNLDFTCVDIAETAEGPLVFEVSAFGGFRGLLEARGLDAAGLYADYVLRKLRD